MTTAREIMTDDARFLKADHTVLEAAKELAQADIGALPICDSDGHLTGMVTDRDLVVKVLADGRDPASTKLSDLADQQEVVTIGADDSVDEAIRTMVDHKVRRLPVIDGDRLVGVVSQGDLATNCPPERVGELVAAISAAP
jgi:CBS domain-containing protein